MNIDVDTLCMILSWVESIVGIVWSLAITYAALCIGRYFIRKMEAIGR